MSNALSLLLAQTSAAASAAAAAATSQPVEGRVLSLIAASLVVCISWVVLHVARRDSFSLRDTPGRANGVNLLHVVIILLLWTTTGGATLRALAAMWHMDPRANPLPLVLAVPANLVGQVFTAGASLFVAGITFRHGIRRGLGLTLRHWGVDLVRGALGVLVILPPVLALKFGTTALLPDRWIHIHPLIEAAQTQHGLLLAMIVLSAVVMAPLSEELLFRGMIQSMLRQSTHRPWAAIAITGVLFGLIHYEMPQDVPALILFGMALGYNYERTGRLTGSIFLHACFNGAMLWAQRGV
jgi:membrane protease YdiL (CAAX protease family)